MLLRSVVYHILTLVNTTVPFLEKIDGDFVVELVKENGFNVKRHEIWTQDGYGLTLHQVINQSPSTRNSVILVHGLLACGGQWVVNGNKSLAFALSSVGYDVWILHHRGTSFSNKHKTRSYDDESYWNFSFEEMGLNDIPAAIDYVLKFANRTKLHVVGHSQGAAALLTGIILRPELNDKIISAYILNPAIFLHHLYEIPNEIVHDVVELSYKRKMFKSLLRSSLFRLLGQVVCEQPLVGIACTGFLADLFGGNSLQAENPQNLLRTYTKYVIDNASYKQMNHLVQVLDAKQFQRYDYGPKMNRKLYNGSLKPPPFDLSLIQIPLTIMYGTIDGLTSATDVKILINHIKNIEGIIKLPWNHLDVIHSKNADKWINSPVINSMNKYQTYY
uniref:Lipase n=1 Tax=Culicoides sonorensis TaxID=179676 RepID=A0A336M5V1_CULSO